MIPSSWVKSSYLVHLSFPCLVFEFLFYLDIQCSLYFGLSFASFLFLFSSVI